MPLYVQFSFREKGVAATQNKNNSYEYFIENKEVDAAADSMNMNVTYESCTQHNIKEMHDTLYILCITGIFFRIVLKKEEVEEENVLLILNYVSIKV